MFEPAAGVSVAVDYFYVEKKDQLAVLSADTILADPNDLTLYNRYSNRFVRNAAGTTLYVDQPIENLGGLRTAGFDLDVRTRLTPAFARVSIGLSGTYITKWEQQAGKDSPFVSYLGNSLNGGNVYPRWQHVASVDLERGPVTASIEQTYHAGWTETFQLGGTHRIPSHSRINMSLKFQAWRGLAVKLGVRNVLDESPPFTDVSSNGSHAQGWANAVADPRGRFWYTTISYKF